MLQLFWQFWLSGNSLFTFKTLSAIFYQFFIFHQTIPLKNYGKCFWFHLKSSFPSWDIQIFVFSSSPLFSLSAITLEADSRKILNLYIINCLNENLITHFVWYLEKEISCDIETLSIERALNTEHFYGKIMQKMSTKS